MDKITREIVWKRIKLSPITFKLENMRCFVRKYLIFSFRVKYKDCERYTLLVWLVWLLVDEEGLIWLGTKPFFCIYWQKS